jgi:hypothetical protein
MNRLCGTSLLILASLAILCPGSLLAEQPTAQPTAPAVAAAPAQSVQPGCGEDLDLAGVLSTKGEVCPVAKPQSAAPDALAPLSFGRTCRCSCGQPCKTDADCDGGICAGGISCC